jgi:hypothetical protein
MSVGLAVAGDASAREKMNYQRDESKDQEEVNQKARDVIHNEASDPRKEQQQSQGQPNKSTHEVLPGGRPSNMNLIGLPFK